MLPRGRSAQLGREAGFVPLDQERRVEVTGRMPPDRLGTREADATGNASTAPPSAAAVAAAAAAAHHAPLPAPHAGAGAHVEEGDGRRAEESKEESILAALGIVGTVLNLLVIVFVYIYTAT
ncbi:unnamed protein product [Lampetra fluviatilis]